MNRYYHNRDRYFAWNGAILLLLGVVLLLDRLGIVSVFEILRFWPVLLVAVGTVLLVELRSLVGRTIGGVLVGGGLLLQAGSLGFLQIRGEVFWPLVLIGVGVVLLGRALEERNRPVSEIPAEPPSRPDFAERFWDGAERFMNRLETADGEHASVFSHVERSVTDQNLERMKVVAVFGGFELDLRPAGIKGEAAVIEANAVFGGIEIIVPEDWQVVPRGAGIFGGFCDETRSPEHSTKTLIVTGAGVFGGVIITNNPGHWHQRHDRRYQRRMEKMEKWHQKMEERRRRWEEKRWQD